MVNDDVRTAMQVDFGRSGGPTSFTLTVTSGPDAGRTFVADGSTPGRVLLGTGPSCEFRLSDPLVSRRHVALELSAHGAPGRLRSQGALHPMREVATTTSS